MATHDVNRAVHATLSAATVDTVNFAYHGTVLRVTNHDASATAYFTIDGTTPTSAGDDTYYVGPSTSVSVSESKVSQVKVISSATPLVSVELY